MKNRNNFYTAKAIYIIGWIVVYWFIVMAATEIMGELR